MLLPPCFSYVFTVAHLLFLLGCRRLGSWAPKGNSSLRPGPLVSPVEQKYCPFLMCPTLLVTTAAPAEVREGKWLGGN